MTVTTRTPVVLWAQRKDRLFLTIDLHDATAPVVELSDDGVLEMTTTAGAPGVEGRHEYHLELEFLHPIDAKASKISVAPRQIVVMVMKTEEVGRRPLDDSFVRSFVVFPSLLFSFLSASVLDVRRSVSDRELALSFRPYRPHSGPHWPRLLKANGKFPHVKTDFDKWVDEDEEDELDRGATRATEALFLKNFFFASPAARRRGRRARVVVVVAKLFYLSSAPPLPSLFNQTPRST